MSEELEVGIRQATGNDAHELRMSIKEMKEETKWVEIDDSTFVLPLEELAAQIDALAIHPSNLLLVATYDKKIIGLLTIRSSEKNESEAELGIVIKKEFWGMGLGQMIIEEALFWANHFSNLTLLFLEVSTENVRACRLYKKMGFHYIEKSERTRKKMIYQIK